MDTLKNSTQHFFHCGKHSSTCLSNPSSSHGDFLSRFEEPAQAPDCVDLVRAAPDCIDLVSDSEECRCDSEENRLVLQLAPPPARYRRSNIDFLETKLRTQLHHFCAVRKNACSQSQVATT